MKVFISWSGTRSKAVAEALQEWLPRVIQASEPWISSEITKGSRWSREISQKLEESKVGLICLTRENLAAPWILFESGAISKTKDAYVCTILLDVTAADVEQPLGQFQHTLVNMEDMRRLAQTINTAVAAAGERALAERDFEEVFTTFWPKLQQRLSEISAAGKAEETEVRSDRELLEEMLEILRTIERRGTSFSPAFVPKHSAAFQAALEQFTGGPLGPLSPEQRGAVFKKLSEIEAKKLQDDLALASAVLANTKPKKKDGSL